MTFDRERLGGKLKSYREQFQLSQTEISARTGISEASLNDYEAGKSSPSGDEILILADFYRCDFRFFISNEKLAPFEQTEMLFRRYGDHLSTTDRWAVQEFLFLCECEEFLLSELNPFGRTAFTFEKRGSHFITHGRQAAAALREHLGYSSSEVGLNIYRDLRKIGFHVFRRKLTNSSISGVYIRHPVAGKCVLVNYSEDVYRQQFTAAHEAGHAILDAEQDVIVSFTRWDKGDLTEARANAFASHYLMPPAILKTLPNPTQWDERKGIEWAAKLKVSTTALSFALQGAKLITKEMGEQLRGVKVPANQKIDPELPETLSPGARKRREELLKRGLSSSYVHLCFDALDQQKISVGRAAEMLLIDELEIVNIATLFGVTL